MAKTEQQTALATQEPAQVPAYLKTSEPKGVDELAQYRSTPRLKIIQAMTDDAIQTEFGLGSVVIMPDSVLLTRYSEPFMAVPVFFWPSWATWRDLTDTSGPMIVEESLDPESTVAMAAKNSKKRVEPYSDDPSMNWHHVESLNFALEIQDGQSAGAVVVASFCKGGHSEGRRLCGYLARKSAEKNVDLFANRVQFVSGKVTNRQNQTWYQLGFGAPEDGSPLFIDEETHARLLPLHGELKKLHSAGLLAAVAVEQ